MFFNISEIPSVPRTMFKGLNLNLTGIVSAIFHIGATINDWFAFFLVKFLLIYPLRFFEEPGLLFTGKESAEEKLSKVHTRRQGGVCVFQIPRRWKLLYETNHWANEREMKCRPTRMYFHKKTNSEQSCYSWTDALCGFYDPQHSSNDCASCWFKLSEATRKPHRHSRIMGGGGTT